VRRGSVVARAAVVVVALPVIAWLGLSYRNAQLVEDAGAVADQQAPPAADVQRALRDLDRSEKLNPDRSEGQALKVVLDVRAKRFDLARADLEALVRREPKNAEAWLLLASLTRQSDPARSAQAREQLRRLNPLKPDTPGG